jgi:hypothetical protein
VPRKKVVPEDTTLLNRQQTAEVMGCSDWQLRKLQHAGALPAVQVQGAYFFRRRDVQELSLRSLEGHRHAECFECFEKGMTPERVVMALKMPFDEVERIYAGWLRMSDAVTFRPPEGISRKRWESALGVALNAATVRRAFELIAVIPELRRQLEAFGAAPALGQGQP